MLRASLGKVVHTVKRAGTYEEKVPPQELHKIAVHVRAVLHTMPLTATHRRTVHYRGKYNSPSLPLCDQELGGPMWRADLSTALFLIQSEPVPYVTIYLESQPL